MSVKAITFGDIESAALIDDVDVASGRYRPEVAGIVFSDFEWETASTVARIN